MRDTAAPLIKWLREADEESEDEEEEDDEGDVGFDRAAGPSLVATGKVRSNYLS